MFKKLRLIKNIYKSPTGALLQKNIPLLPFKPVNRILIYKKLAFKRLTSFTPPPENTGLAVIIWVNMEVACGIFFIILLSKVI
jgi:hypothetical protein